MDIKSVLRPAIILCIICAVITAALSVTNAVTKSSIEKLQLEAEISTAKEIISAQTHDPNVCGYNGKEYTYYTAKNQDEVLGYIFKTKAKGYGGEVTVMTGIGTDGKIILVKVLDATSETAGVGQKITEASFTDKFTGLKGTVSVKDSEAENKIDAVANATYSSKAVSDSVNIAVGIYNSIKEG